jgi:pimeloyl-ACP methyl ester carboxylesterase
LATLRVNGAELHYEEQGAGQQSVVFAHGLLMSCRIFDKQVAELKRRYRCVTFDFRGQGESEVTKDGYDVENLCKDVAGLIDTLNCAPCHFVGLSMGGYVGIMVAARRPELIKSLTLLDSTADRELVETVRMIRQLSFVARWFGPRLVVGRVMPIVFGRKFLEDQSRLDERREWRRRLLSNDRIGMTRAATGWAKRSGIQNELTKIHAPTLIAVGDQDLALPPDNSERLHAGIEGSKFVVIPGAGHTSTVEEPTVVNAAIDEFLNEIR